MWNKKIELSSEQKFLLIYELINKYQFKNMVTYLCHIAGISRSGYYNYFSLKSQKLRELRDNRDEVVKEIILKAYKFKRHKKGARQIKMTLEESVKKLVYPSKIFSMELARD